MDVVGLDAEEEGGEVLEEAHSEELVEASRVSNEYDPTPLPFFFKRRLRFKNKL